MNKNLFLAHSKIDYVQGIKINRYCLAEYIREIYQIPIWQTIQNNNSKKYFK